MKTIEPSLIEKYHQDGVVVLRQLFSAEQLNELKRELNDFIKTDLLTLSGRDVNYVDADKKILNSIHRLNCRPDNYFSILSQSEFMKSVATSFIGEDVESMGAELFAKPAGVGLASPVHQDNYYWCLKPDNALTIWIAIDPATKSNGTVHYIKGSHKWGMSDHTDSFAPRSSQTIKDKSLLEKDESISFSLEPGDALVHHTTIVHWSEPNASQQSRGVTIQYRGASVKVDPDLKRNYEAKLLAQIQARENAACAAQKL